jgi:hypothetical protein
MNPALSLTFALQSAPLVLFFLFSIVARFSAAVVRMGRWYKLNHGAGLQQHD